MIAPAVARLMSVVSVGMVFAVARMVLGWLDRRIAAPVMKERINSGSDKFLSEDEKHWGESEIDDIANFRF